MRSRVFICGQPKMDVSRAEMYGVLTYILPENSMYENEFEQYIFDKLKALNFNPKNDYVLIAGQSFVHVSTLCAMVGMLYGLHKQLIFDARISQYTVKELKC